MERTRLNPILPGLLALLLPAPAAAQGDPTRLLSRAAVLEEHEHDPHEALLLYRQVAADAQAQAPARTEAELRLGLALRRLGREEEARAALTRAADGQGDAAAKAKEALQDKVDPKIAAVVRRAIADLRSPYAEVAGRAEQDLDFAGRAAVEPLVEAIRLETADRTFLARALAALFTLSWKHVAARTAYAGLLRSADRFVREHAIATLTEDPTIWKLEGAWLTSYSQLMSAALEAPEPELRARVAGCWRTARDPALLCLALMDPEWEVRERALNALPGDIEGFGLVPEFRLLLERELKARPAQAGPAITRALWLLRSVEGQRLWFQALLASPAPTEQEGHQVVTTDRLKDEERTNLRGSAKDLHLDAVREACAALRTWKAGDHRQRALASFLEFVLPSWSDAAIPTVVDLLRGSKLPAVARALEATKWLETRRLPDEAFPVVAEYLRATLHRGGLSREQASLLFRQLALGTHPQKVQVLEELAGLPHPAATYGLLIAAQIPLDPDLAAAMGRVALRPELSRELRSWFLFCLLRGSSPVFAEVAAEAYELGLDPTAGWTWVEGRRDDASPSARQSGRGLGWLNHSMREARLRPDFDLATWTTLVERCSKSREYALWQDLRTALSAIPVQALQPLAEALPALFRDKVDSRVLLEAADTLLAQGPPALRPKVLLAVLQANLPLQLHPRSTRLDWTWTPELTKACVELLSSPNHDLSLPALHWLQASGDAAAIPAIERYLEGAIPEMHQRAALAAILALDPANEDQRLRRWLESKSAALRIEAIERMARALDKSHVPLFLERLRDPSEKVREAAQKALREIEFYVEQTERWQRIGRAGALEATSAAEALLEQARKGDKPTRLLALGSLGALGVAETLPVLIEMTKDQDPEIAAAARA
ncbi:MAG: hypothetical protein IT458_04840, partial [Planctomycetes bacterium]|nr:hypothetical protein [Planctomycetota bacterium]